MSDAELLELVTDFRRGILGGRSSYKMCFAVCAPLEGYLSFIGISTNLVKIDLGECEHYVLRLPDGRIIDPTADQFPFGMPPVYIGPMYGEAE